MNKKGRPKEVLYLAVELDKYELPMAVFDNIRELANWAGVSKTFAAYLIKYNLADLRNKCRYEKVVF